MVFPPERGFRGPARCSFSEGESPRNASRRDILAGMGADFKVAFRALVRQPVLSIVALATLVDPLEALRVE